MVPPMMDEADSCSRGTSRSANSAPAARTIRRTRDCDPFGFPQNMTQEIRGMTITTLPTRTFLLLQYTDLFRGTRSLTGEHFRQRGRQKQRGPRSGVQRILDRSLEIM